MRKRFCFLVLLSALAGQSSMFAQAHNPILFADVPDMSMIRIGDTYYMSSTTMHMNPGVPIMKSSDLINWELVSYAYERLCQGDEMNLENGKNTYGRGSWASSLRYHNGTYYVSTFSGTTKKTYVYATDDIEKGPWKKIEFSPMLHDHTLFFDDDGRIYMIYGSGKLYLVELLPDFSGIIGESEKVIIENASTPSGENIGLPAEGSQLFKVGGYYYLLNITWPKGGMRTVVIHRADNLAGPYEGRVALQDLGVAQGGLIDTPDGSWYAYLFRDYGAVGRIPYLIPVEWKDGWPVLGDNGKVPETLPLPANTSLLPGIVASDEFTRLASDKDFPLVWQWNHNPLASLWSLKARKGYLRLTAANAPDLLQSRNMLTQRTIGPVCAGTTALDISGMKNGDTAGLCLLQKNYGSVGITVTEEGTFIVMANASTGVPELQDRIAITEKKVYFKAECDFTEKKDVAQFYYSLDGKNWKPVGKPLKMAYTLPHFMGYRFGLFNYTSQQNGGYADFDYFRIEPTISEK